MSVVNSNFTTDVPKILDLKSSSEKIYFPKIVVGCTCILNTDSSIRMTVQKKPFYDKVSLLPHSA